MKISTPLGLIPFAQIARWTYLGLLDSMDIGPDLKPLHAQRLKLLALGTRLGLSDTELLEAKRHPHWTGMPL